MTLRVVASNPEIAAGGPSGPDDRALTLLKLAHAALGEELKDCTADRAVLIVNLMFTVESAIDALQEPVS